MGPILDLLKQSKFVLRIYKTSNFLKRIFKHEIYFDEHEHDSIR